METLVVDDSVGDDGGAEGGASIFVVLDERELFDALQIDDELGFEQAAAELTEQVGSARQQSGAGAGLLEQPRQRFRGGRFLVRKVHVCPVGKGKNPHTTGSVSCGPGSGIVRLIVITVALLACGSCKKDPHCSETVYCKQAGNCTDRGGLCAIGCCRPVGGGCRKAGEK